MSKTPSQSSGDPEKHGSEVSRESSPGPVHDPVMERRVWRKLDMWLLPVVTIFYLLNFLVSLEHPQPYLSSAHLVTQDRSNIGNARIAGLQKDLKMTNKQYSIALTVTYVPYIIAELPSNLLLKVCTLFPPAMSMLMLNNRLLVPISCSLPC